MWWSKKEKPTKQDTVRPVCTDDAVVGDVVCWYEGDALKHMVVGHIYEHKGVRRMFAKDMGFSVGMLQVVEHIKPKKPQKKAPTKKIAPKK